MRIQAASHGNTDAKERLEALDGPAPSALSRVEHEAHIDNKLQRKRTQAKMLSDREGRANRHPSNGGGSAQKPAAADLSRKRTMRLVEETAGPSAGKADGPRRGRRSMIPEGSEASMASNATARQGSRDRIPSGPASYRQNSGYSLSETYATPTGLTSTPPPAHPPAPQSRPSLGPPGQSNTPSNLSGGSSAASSSTTSENKKVYNTFAEMGFQPQKKDEKECVIC